jgi:multicomponent Na+:H+ antiporter subunit D
VAVVNVGVFSVLRVIYHVFGVDLLAGSWAQEIALAFSAATILFGAWMAVRDTHVKRKLAYSTVSNLGYMLLGASLMTQGGLTGSLAHMVCHGLMKILLFFCIGAVMVKTGRTQMYQMRGMARRMPLTFAFFTFGAIALMGIPPLCGFISKYHLIHAAIAAGGNWAWLGTGCLLISSLLTAVYTLSMLLPAFFLSLDEAAGDALPRRCDPGMRMLLPFALIAAAILLLGICSEPLMQILRAIAA